MCGDIYAVDATTVNFVCAYLLYKDRCVTHTCFDSLFVIG